MQAPAALTAAMGGITNIVIASAAKQSTFLSCCSMDCFAALAMTARHTFAI
jgi:hypothetical protein